MHLGLSAASLCGWLPLTAVDECGWTSTGGSGDDLREHGHMAQTGAERRGSGEIFFWQSVDPERGVRSTGERRPE
jgi:hypothetical protein